jgi:hypothetical protein
VQKCSKLSYRPRHITDSLLLFNVKAVSRSVAHKLEFRRNPVAILEIAAFVSTDTRYVVQVIFPSLVSFREMSLCVERNFISVLYVQPIANFIRLIITPHNPRMSRSFSSRYVNPAILHSIHWRPNVPSLLQLHIADLALWNETLRIILSITAISRIKYRTILHICIYKY